ncbi:hypothetical protein ILUMI_02371 [Ignelater luminosus]|uniref:Elongation of very long chain fatty acids protein n=1 Tax=Ignelater luminosus TaxID=2038154 RepID=A0A8K0DDL0_IGNLU|nr:hypothetical protein ILUMI_02371 [Ignelater luminosus]
MKEYAFVTSPNYSYTFPFESNFVYQDAVEWMSENWTLSFYYVVIYVIFIFGGQHVMKNKPRFELRIPLSLWNTALAIFNIIGTLRTIPEFLHILTNYGLYHSICVPSFIEQDHVASFWTYLFILSKVTDLGDTVFIVLRKQPLIFLHWYHHITALVGAWYTYTEKAAYGRWLMVMNYFVHALMYSYYALKARGYNIPWQFAIVITSLQLIQMVIACLVTIWAQQFLIGNMECRVTPLIIKVSFVIYFSYFVLFVRFFYNAYLSGERQRKKHHVSASSEDLLSKSKIH